MRNQVLEILEEYLKIFREETKRQQILLDYLKNHNEKEIIDWNNFDGHLVASAFIYNRKNQKFLVLYHKDMKCFLYPGGHIDPEDKSILESAKREVKEETGLEHFEEIKISKNELVPIDIDTHNIPYNERLKLPSHLHFDFRYLLITNEDIQVQIDDMELSEYRWVSMEELKKNIGNQIVLEKISKIISKNNI